MLQFTPRRLLFYLSTTSAVALCALGVICLINSHNGDLTPAGVAPRQAEEKDMPTVQETYNLLVAEMTRDFDADSGVAISSSTAHIYQHPNYRKVVALGKPAVPTVISALRTNQPYAAEFLRGLLPDVHGSLGGLYGDKEWYLNSKKERETWLRWWEEYGSKERWEE